MQDKEFLKYDPKELLNNGDILISLNPKLKFIAIFVVDKNKNKVLAKIRLSRTAFSKLCADFSISLAKYLEME